MKIKDIKKQLNKEAGDITPDVLGRVKISPINRLRNNEKALRVFKTTMMSLILLIMASIIIILSVSIYAYMTQKPDRADENYTFVSLWVYEGEPIVDGTVQVPPREDSHILSFVVDGDGKVVFAYDETDAYSLPSNFYVGEVVDLVDLADAKAVYVFTTSDRPAFQRQFYNVIRGKIELTPSFDGIATQYHVGDSSARNTLTKSVLALNGFDSARYDNATTINDLCILYVEFAS
jgi:hypothetical protein